MRRRDVHVEAVFEVVVAHEAEDIVVDVAEIMDLKIPVSTGRLECEACSHLAQSSNTTHSS